MAYLGNNLQVAFASYKVIDNISASFNGSTTSFPLLVNGVAPVPAPINSQQCLIIVGGVPQKPDSSGADGFNLVSGNIVFSSAPAAGLKFWGVILAGADYVTAGTSYPNGSALNPSLTFSSNTNTGLYLVSSNVLGFTAGGTSAATLSSSGLNLGPSVTLSSSGLSLGAATTLSSSNLKLNGSSSGFTTLSAPAVAGSNTLTLPTGNGSADQALVTNGTGTLSWSDRSRMTLATAQNSTSGTSIDFTGIPSWVKRITVMFYNVSTTGTTNIIVQIGPSSGVETTGYIGSSQTNGAGINANSTNNGFDVFELGVATSAASGHCVLTLLDGSTNTWAATSILAHSNRLVYMGGSKPITGGALSRLRLTSTGGTDTFDSGSINIMYEG